MNKDVASTFIESIEDYYGGYPNKQKKGLRKAVYTWLVSKPMSKKNAAYFFEEVKMQISAQYNNVPDIAQLHKVYKNLTPNASTVKLDSDGMEPKDPAMAEKITELLTEILGKSKTDNDI